jgi:hypothetical protein
MGSLQDFPENDYGVAKIIKFWLWKGTFCSDLPDIKFFARPGTLLKIARVL